jgi:hypothetical protein
LVLLRQHGHGARRPDKCRNRRSGNWQSKAFARRWRRRKGDEFTRSRRQEYDRRRRRRREARTCEYDDWPFDKDHFCGRRRRDAEIESCKIGRRLERRGQECQTATGIPGMRPIRIAPQVGPIGRGRVGYHAAAPDDLFAPNGEHRRDAA